jgi:osmotically-inducible protein OsmY
MFATSAFALQEGGSMKPTGRSKAEGQAPADCSTVDDSKITSSVKESLANAPSLKDSTIDVSTSAGVVTLKGVVKKAGLKGVATRMARRVSCVKKVDNQLTTESGSAKGPKKKSN